MKNFLLGVVTMICCILTIEAQELPELVPVSPNAASLGRYGSFEMNNNLGRIDIPIPIYTVVSGDLKMPLSLSYNSSGIKLNERASWTGLGWNLNAGGAIIRNVKGTPDNLCVNPAKEDVSNLEFNKQNYEYLYGIWQQTPQNSEYYDGEPDQFILNAYGISATFYFVEKNGQEELVFVKNSGRSIQVQKTNLGFRVVTNNGVELLFEEIENTTLAKTVVHTIDRIVPTAYYLTQVRSLSTNKIITLTYKSKLNYQYPFETAQSFSFFEEKLNEPPAYWYWSLSNQTKINKKYLSEIQFNNDGGVVKFNSSGNREDSPDALKLDNIEIFSKNSVGELDRIEKINCSYSYYNRNGANLQRHSRYVGYDLELKKSLKLNALSIQDSKLLESKSYSFEYNGNTLPSSGTVKQDFWGYINNNKGTSLVPETTVTLYNNTSIHPVHTAITRTLGDADRESDPIAMKQGVLTKITYPTGGYTEFDFEANRYDEVISQNVYTTKDVRVQSYGTGDTACNECEPKGKQTITFTVDNGEIRDARLRVVFTDAYSGAGSSSYAVFMGKTYKRSAATNIYPYTFYDIPVNIVKGQTYTIEVYEMGHGSNPPYNVPSVSATVSWKVKSGTESSTKTRYVGGLRVKSVKSYDSNKIEPESIETYIYEGANIINIPERNGLVSKHFVSTSQYDATISSAPAFENGLGEVPAIEYEKITKSIEDKEGNKNGRIIYYYDIIPFERDLSNIGNSKAFHHPEFLLEELFCQWDPNSSTPCAKTGQKITEIMGAQDVADIIIKPYLYGFLKKKEVYKEDENLPVSMETNEYEVIDESTFKNVYVHTISASPYQGWSSPSGSEPLNYFSFNSFQFYYRMKRTWLGKKILKSTRRAESFNGKSLETLNEFTYNNKYFVTETKTTLNDGDVQTIRTKNYYPTDKNLLLNLSNESSLAIDQLVNQNRIAQPIQVETYNKKNTSTSENKLQTQRTNYKVWSGNLVLPKEVQSSKENQPLENRIVYHSYDSKGNPVEVSKEGGSHIVYLWGYHYTQPIAKIENATYAQVMAALGKTVNDDLSYLQNYTESQIETEVDKIRTGLTNSQVTTITYKPLIGVNSMIDIRGDKMTYHYDDFNRLQFIKDKDGYIIKEHKYNYKN